MPPSISEIGCLYPIWLPMWLWYKLVYVIIPVGVVLWVAGEGELSTAWGPILTLGFGFGGLFLRFYVWGINLSLNQEETEGESDQEVPSGDVGADEDLSGQRQMSPESGEEAEDIEADLTSKSPSREELIGQIAGALLGPGGKPAGEATDTVAESDEPPAVSDEPSPDLDVESVCDALFAEAGSTAANRIFAERFDGRPVRWSGTLTRAESYGFDLVFGNQPGTKAVLAVYETDAIGYGNATVSAVVQLPAETLDTLEGHEGQVVTVAGRLVKFDGFMRNIYIGEGTLEA